MITESVVESAALAWLESLGYVVKYLPAPQNDTTRQAGRRKNRTNKTNRTNSEKKDVTR